MSRHGLTYWESRSNAFASALRAFFPLLCPPRARVIAADRSPIARCVYTHTHTELIHRGNVCAAIDRSKALILARKREREKQIVRRVLRLVEIRPTIRSRGSLCVLCAADQKICNTLAYIIEYTYICILGGFCRGVKNGKMHRSRALGALYQRYLNNIKQACWRCSARRKIRFQKLPLILLK